MANELKGGSRRWFWRIGLFVIVILPLLPEIVVLGISAIADFSGCRVDAPPLDAKIEVGERPSVGLQTPDDPWMVTHRFWPPPVSVAVEPPGACAIGPFLVASIIRLALEAGSFIGVAFGSGFVVAWMTLCYVAITRGWTGLLNRLILALFICLIFAFIPYFGPMMSIAHLKNPRCQPNEGGIGACVMYGGNVGEVVHLNVALGWRIFVGAPAAFAAFATYVVVLFFAAFSLRRSVARPN